MPVFTLTCQVRDEAPRTFALPAGDPVVVTIGRARDVDVAVEHTTISRRHATLTLQGGRCMLRDLGSTYGTWIRGNRLEGDAVIAPGERFELGVVSFQLTGEPDPPSTSPPAAEAEAAVGLLDDAGHDVDFGNTVVIPIGTHAMPAAGDAPRTEAARLLRLLSEIGKTLVQQSDLTRVLESVVDLVFDAVAGERAFLLLRDSPFDALTPRVARRADGQRLVDAQLSRTVVSTVIRDRVAMLANDALVDSRLDLAHSVRALSIRSFMCAPLWHAHDVIGVLYVDTPRSKRFSQDDLSVFVALANYAAVAIERARLTDRVLDETRRRERLQRYHSPSVVNRILEGDAAAGVMATQLREVTILFADLVGFTTMSEALPPTEVAETLNGFFEEMTDVIFDHQGTLDKFIGDAILAVFGAPLPQDDHAAQALRAALEMRRVLGALNARRPDRPLRMRIGIHTGTALTGDIGSPKRREFTVLGDAVNTASRIESTVARPGQIVASRQTLERAGGGFTVTPLGAVTLRGRQSSVDVFAIDD